MNKIIFMLFLFLFLYGCGMTNEDIIAETKKCKDNDFGVIVTYNYMTNKVTNIICIPKEEVCKDE